MVRYYHTAGGGWLPGNVTQARVDARRRSANKAGHAGRRSPRGCGAPRLSTVRGLHLPAPPARPPRPPRPARPPAGLAGRRESVPSKHWREPRRLRDGGGAVRAGGEGRGAAGRGHGRAQAPSDDQPVRAGGRLRRRPGQAAAAGGTLAVRDCAQCFFPRNKHPLQPPPSDDVHSCQHTSHAAQLPRRPHHVLPPQGFRELQQQQPRGLYGDIPATPGPTAAPAWGLQSRLAHGLTPRPAADHVDSNPPSAARGLARHRLPTGHGRTEGQCDHGGREMRLRWRVIAAGTPTYKFIYIFSPPPPQRGDKLLPGGLAATETHEQIAALHGFGLK